MDRVEHLGKLRRLVAVTICLNMIVRNESAVIARCLASVRPFIDSWAIIDTGSTDGTQAITREALRGIPGELVEREWTDFATARNQARALACGRADYLLFIDADEELKVTGERHWPAGAQLYSCPVVHTAFGMFARWFLARDDADWTWKGVVHERIEPSLSGVALHESAVMILSHLDGARGRDPNRYLRDAEALIAALDSDPDHADVLSIARSYMAARKYGPALEWARHRMTMEGPFAGFDTARSIAGRAAAELRRA